MTVLADKFRAAVDAMPGPPPGPIAAVTEAQMEAYLDAFVASAEKALQIAVEMAEALDAQAPKVKAFDEIEDVLRYHCPVDAKPLSVYPTTLVKMAIREAKR